MATYRYVVDVECDNENDAETVMSNRIDPADDYGFEYSVSYRRHIMFHHLEA